MGGHKATDHEKGAHKKTEGEGSDDEVKLIEDKPVFPSVFSDASFKETLCNVAKECSKAEGKNEGYHHGESHEVIEA